MSNGVKFFWSVFLSLLMSQAPSAFAAGAAESASMIPTESVVDEMNREQLQQKVRDFVAREDVQKELMKNGVSKSDAEMRLASLSDYEMKQLSQQIDQAQAGGVTGLLWVVVLVLLIIFLAKRV